MFVESLFALAFVVAQQPTLPDQLVISVVVTDKKGKPVTDLTAAEVSVKQLPYVGAGPYHTNTRAALQLAQRLLLRKKHPNKQVFMVTDGKPSAITEHGKLYKNPFGLDPKIVGLTLEEAAACRRNKIVITTFMLTQEPALVDFVNKLTQVNKGRAYFSAADNLGGSVFVDYLRNRKKKIGH